MARSAEQLEAWSELLELCEDDCQVFSTTKAMREAVIEVERELARLHKIEDAAIRLARPLHAIAMTDSNSDEWFERADAMWDAEKPARLDIVALVPEAFQ